MFCLLFLLLGYRERTHQISTPTYGRIRIYACIRVCMCWSSSTCMYGRRPCIEICVDLPGSVRPIRLCRAGYVQTFRPLSVFFSAFMWTAIRADRLDWVESDRPSWVDKQTSLRRRCTYRWRERGRQGSKLTYTFSTDTDDSLLIEVTSWGGRNKKISGHSPCRFSNEHRHRSREVREEGEPFVLSSFSFFLLASCPVSEALWSLCPPQSIACLSACRPYRAREGYGESSSSSPYPVINHLSKLSLFFLAFSPAHYPRNFFLVRFPKKGRVVRVRLVKRFLEKRKRKRRSEQDPTRASFSSVFFFFFPPLGSIFFFFLSLQLSRLLFRLSKSRSFFSLFLSLFPSFSQPRQKVFFSSR